jgi:hypothetical protein
VSAGKLAALAASGRSVASLPTLTQPELARFLVSHATKRRAWPNREAIVKLAIIQPEWRIDG